MSGRETSHTQSKVDAGRIVLGTDAARTSCHTWKVVTRGPVRKRQPGQAEIETAK